MTGRWLGSVAALIVALALPSLAHESVDDMPRIAVVSAFAPELALLEADLEVPEIHSINGIGFMTGTLEGQDVVLFLSGISVVNAAMSVQTALDHFAIEGIVFSGIAGGVDPQFHIGDVFIAERWGQHLEMIFAREAGEDAWSTIPFFDYPFDNYGMMFPRSVTVLGGEMETRFWFPVNQDLLARARALSGDIVLEQCAADGPCLDDRPRIITGGSGVSGSAFIDNAGYRDYLAGTLGAQLVDMESAAVAHVAHANGEVPFLAIRSLANLAGGEPDQNRMTIFLELAAGNAATVVKALLRSLSSAPE